MKEEELLSKRNEIEQPVINHFDEFSIIIAAIISRIIKDYKDGKIGELEAKERLRIELIDIYQVYEKKNVEIIEGLVRDEYELGIELSELDNGISTSDLAIIMILWYLMKKYIHLAEYSFLKQALMLKIVGKNKIKDRFKKIVVSEGTRQIGVAVINKAKDYHKYLKFVTMEDERVCPVCNALDGKIYHPLDAVGIIPLHPFCRCYFVIVRGEDAWSGL